MGFFPGRRGASAIFHLQVRLSGRVPQLCCLHGPSAAGGAYMPAFCDWVGHGRRATRRCTCASPRVAEKVTGERTTLEEMGGAEMHATVSGCGDEVFDDDWEAIAAARLLLTYLPDDFRTPPGASRARRARARRTGTGWSPTDPNAAYDVRDVDRPARRRRLVLRDQGPLGAGDGGRPRPARRARRRDRGQPAERAQRRDLRRLRRQGRPLHLAVRRLQRPAAVPAGRARLHGRRRGRARRGSSGTAPR